MQVQKRDGQTELFDLQKVYWAVFKAASATVSVVSPTKVAADVSVEVEEIYSEMNQRVLYVDQIHNLVEKKLMEHYPDVAKAYILYRQKRTECRKRRSDLMKVVEDTTAELVADNANVGNSAAAKMYSIAEATVKEFTQLNLLSDEDAKNHKEGRIYINDAGYYPMTINCFYDPLEKILASGFNNGVGYLRPPTGLLSAMALAAIVLQSSQNEMFGGQGVVDFDSVMATYAWMEYQKNVKFARTSLQAGIDQTQWAMNKTEATCYQACEAFVGNMNTMRSRSGAQVTFSSINLGTDTDPFARMVTRNLLKAFEAGLGHGENPIFPNIGFRVKEDTNLEPGTPNYDLFQQAIKCSATRIQPRFVFCDSPVHREHPWTAAAMGCRTCVTSNIHGSDSPIGRGNLAFNTISLPLVALESVSMGRDFLPYLEQICNSAIVELHNRYNLVKQLKVKDMPFVSHWYQGSPYNDAKRVDPNTSIEGMIKNGTLSMGFIGLAECLTVLTGKHHGQSVEAQKLGLEIVELMHNMTVAATHRYDLNFSLFASPAESSCYKLLLKAREKYGVILGVTDKEYFTNSFHLPVDFPCSIEGKIDTEAPYHKYCTAGAIMYVELGASPAGNLEGLEEVIRYMARSGASYGGANFIHYFCNQCNYSGDMPEGKCPVCGETTDINMTAIITGYLSTQERFNPGKQAELTARVSHGGGKFE